MKNVVVTNSKQFKTTNQKACFFGMIPDGISLTAVRGFNLSKRSSMYLLKAIAALRAKTIHKITSNNLVPNPRSK